MRKSFYCPHCDVEYTGLISVHRACGKLGQPVTRNRLGEIIIAGRGPGLTSSRTRRIDRMVSDEFAARGISNYTNIGGTPKITHAKEYGGNMWNGFYQPPIGAAWTKPDVMMKQFGSAAMPMPQFTPQSQEPPPQQPMGQPWAKAVPTLPVE